MQFESNCADDIETSYIESHYVLPVAADAASPVVEDTSSAAIDGLPAVDFQSPSNEFAVFCASLRSGLPFPSDLSANDVVDGVLNAFDVEIFPLRLDKRVWAFQCAKSEYEHVARKEIVVKQYHVCFHSNMEEVAEPQLAHVWYKSCNGQDVPSTVTAARIIGTVKNATNIDLVPVPDSDDALEPDIVPRAAFEFLCQPKEVRKLQEPATARIVVKRCELQLLVGEDENNTSDPPSALAPCGIDGGMEHVDLPPPPAVPPSGPPATPVLVPEPVLAPVADPVAAVAAREAQLFDSLRGSYGVLTTRLSPSCDAGLGELTLHVLYLHFSYEYRKFNSPCTKLSGAPASLEVLQGWSGNYSSALFAIEEVTGTLQRLESCLRAEGQDAVLPDLSAIHTRWTALAELQCQAARELLSECQKMLRNIGEGEVGDAVNTLVSVCNGASSIHTLSACWFPLLELMHFAQRNASDASYALLALQICNILGIWNSTRHLLIEDYKWLENSCARILHALCPVNLDRLVQLCQLHGQAAGDFASCDAVALCGPTGVGKSTLTHYMHGAHFEEVQHRGALRAHLQPHYVEPQQADISGVRTNPFGESETIAVHSSPVQHDGRTYVVLDTPGFGETKGVEQDIVNGLNISAALKACRTVRLVVVLSDNCLGDKLLGENTVKDCSRTVMDMITSSKHVDKFSYVFTKMDKAQGAAISDAFESNLTLLPHGDVDILPLWQDIAEKTKPKGMVVSPLHDSPAERAEMMNHLFSKTNVICLPTAAFGLCIPRKSRDALISQLDLHRASVEKALEKKNLPLLCFRLQQLRDLCTEPMLAQLPECTDALRYCTQYVVREVENKFLALEALLLSSAASITLTNRDRAELVEALSCILIFETVRRECLIPAVAESEHNLVQMPVSQFPTHRDLAMESMELVRGYVDTSVLWLQDYSTSCRAKHEMETFRNAVNQLIALRGSLAEEGTLCEPLVRRLDALLSAPGAAQQQEPTAAGESSGAIGTAPSVVSIVESIRTALALKYSSCKEACDLVGAITALNSASHFVDVFKPLLFALQQPTDERFYKDLKTDFSVKIANLHRKALFELSYASEPVLANSSVLLSDNDAVISQLKASRVCNVPFVRIVELALNQLQGFLTAEEATGGTNKAYVEYHKHLGDHDVKQCVNELEIAVLAFVQHKTALFTAVSAETFQPRDNKATLELHWRNVQALADLPWSSSCAEPLQECVKNASDHFDSLCHLLSAAVSAELSHLTLLHPRECQVGVLRAHVAELRDSAYFHKKMHMEVRATALNGIVALHAQIVKQRVHEVGHLAITSFAVGILLEVASLAVPVEVRTSPYQVALGSTDCPLSATAAPSSASAALYSKAVSCVDDIRARFSLAFFADGTDLIVPFYSSLCADYESIAQYMAPAAEHFVLEEKFTAFLASCAEVQWCFPVTPTRGMKAEGSATMEVRTESNETAEAVPQLPSADLVRNVLIFHTHQVNKHLGEIKSNLEKSFAWLFCEDITSQLRVSPFPIPLAAGQVTLASLVEVMDYLRRYNAQSSPVVLLEKLVHRFVVLSRVMQQVVSSGTAEKYAVENTRMLSKELVVFDRFLPAVDELASFQQICNDARAKLVQTEQQVESSVESHDFHKVAEVLRTVDPADEYHSKVVKMVTTEVKFLVDSIAADQNLFWVLTCLHNALLFTGKHLRKRDIASAVATKLLAVEDQLRGKLVATAQCIKSGNLMESVSVLQFFDELLSGFDADRAVMTSKRGVGAEVFCCLLCGFCNAEGAQEQVPSSDTAGTLSCARCATVQFVNVRSDLSPLAKQLYYNVRVLFEERVREVEDRLTSVGQIVTTICDGRCVDLEDSDEEDGGDLEDVFANLDANSDSALNRLRWMKQFSADLAKLAAQKAPARPFMDFADRSAALRDTVTASVEPLLEQARVIEPHFDIVKKVFVSSGDVSREMLRSVRDALHKVGKCNRLLSKAYFAPYKKAFQEHFTCLQYAEDHVRKAREEAIERGDLGALVSINLEQRIPSVVATLQAKFAVFEEAAHEGELVRALNLAASEGVSWLVYNKEATARALFVLVSRFRLLLPSPHLLNSSRTRDLEFLRSHHAPLFAFMQLADVLEAQEARDGVQAMNPADARQARQILDNVFGSFCKYATDIHDILISLESIVPVCAEGSLTSSAVAPAGEVQRLKRTWDEVNAFSDIFGLVSTERPGLRLSSAQESQRVHIRSLCDVADRLKTLRKRSYHVLQLPFQNVKTDTQNRTDKDAFFSLVFLCFSFYEFTSSAEKQAQAQRSLCTKISDLADLCRYLASRIGDGATLEANSGICESFNKAVGNLMAIRDTFEGFSGTRTLVDEIKTLFEVKVRAIAARAYLSDGQWNVWTHHISEVATNFIWLKSIGRCVPVFKAVVDETLVIQLRRYKTRSYSVDISNDFISRLGLALDQSTSNGIGQQIIEETVEFSGYKNQLRNLQFDRVGVNMILESFGDETTRDNLRALYTEFHEQYWCLVEKGLPKTTRHAHIAAIPEQVKALAQLVMHTSEPHVVTNSLLSIVVYCFAYWTLHDLKGYDTTPSRGNTHLRTYLTQPHPGQVIVVLRMLCLDAPDELVAKEAKQPKKVRKTKLGQLARATGFEWLQTQFMPQFQCRLRIQTHLAQVRTGEGKSIVLAITATVLALVGFNVDIACYSEYLTERDRGAFQFMFEAFVVENGVNPIQYNTFKTLCENILNSKGDIRELMANTILGKNQDLARPCSAPVTRHRVLLADEVDVLFGSNFFGRSYNVLASLRGGSGEKEIVDLIRLIWTFRDTKKDSIFNNDILPSPEYVACAERFKEWPSLVENVAKRMLHDVRDTQHKVDSVDPVKGIGYYDDDGVITYSRRDGYKTLFAYMRENEADKSKISDKMVLDEMNFLINAGTLSYAELPKLYSIVLGVTGTLTTLSQEENKLLDSKYNIQKRTVMPSAYPVNYCRVSVFQGKLGVDVFVSETLNYFQNIADEVNRRICDANGRSRAVLVFFQKESTLEDFWNSECFKEHVGSALKLVKHTSIADRDGIIARSVEEGRVTLLIAPYGRGTDFTYNNQQLDERGGIHVIQTFLSEESSEEVQIMGRTARQGHPGTFSMVLGESDLETGCLSRQDVADAFEGFNIYEIIKRNRATSYHVKCQQKQQLADYLLVEHKASEELLQHLWDNNIAEVKRLIQERNLARIEYCFVVSRTVVLLDGTCSMSGFFNKCKTVIKEMLRRIVEVLTTHNVTSGFEVQFVVYRNYDSLHKVLQPSSWASDPEELFDFIDSTSVDGGCGNEAIEMGFWHVNQQIARGVDVTQVIIIGDMPPNTRSEVRKHRESVQSEGLQGSEFWTQKTPYTEKTHYVPELTKIADRGIPVHARYLDRDAKKAFDEFASRTGGTSGELNIDHADGAEQLTGIFAAGILRNIQNRASASGAHTTDLYQAYMDKHPFVDVGFV